VLAKTQSGIEARALESLWELFAQAREIMKKYPGCATFSDAVTRTLNIAVRSVTVKWDRAHADGRLNSRDGADQFREDFAELQSNLCDFAAQMHEMAYGFNFADEQTPPLIPQDFLKKCFEDVEFGIPNDGLSIKQKEIIAEINVVEAAEIKMRRAALNADSLDSNKNAVGLAACRF
jgi:hypothetical protein